MDINNYEQFFIVGNGSNLLKRLSNQDIDGCSTEEFLSGLIKQHKNKILLIFSLVSPKQIKWILENFDNKIAIIGSASALSRLSFLFRYSKLKKKQLNSVLLNKRSNLKYLTFGEFFPSENKGLTYYSNPEKFWENCSKSFDIDEQVINLFSIEGKEDRMSRFLSNLEILTAPLSSILIKIFTNYSYGYGNARHRKEKYNIR